ncbi:MAG TPA: hypothetical protein VMW76_05820 [Bacteroidales bacterium]|nr:hypothetical protein [Bacteroidales bacterium]
MKTKIIPILLVLIMSLLNYSCEDATYRVYKGYKPVYMSYDELRDAVNISDTQPLENPGKIYFKDNYIFIVEEMKGVHVFDNSDPSSPDKISFINLPGVVDIGISGYYMYADSYIDLVVLNIGNPETIFEEARLEDVLPYTVPPHEDDYPSGWVDKEDGVVISWDLTTIRERVYESPIIYPIYLAEMNGGFNRTTPSHSGGISGTGIGIGGSMARFGINGDALYIVDNNTIKVFDISDPLLPVRQDEIRAGWGIETMFLTENNMFLGSTTGMFVFDIKIPFYPSQISFFQHARSCDPVVVDGNIAYVTLRTGTICGGNVNSLDVVDITDLNDPELMMTYPMYNPHGLGKDDDLLFICDGSQGLKIYNASDPLTITSNLLYHYPGINAYDVIPLGDILVMIGDDGMFQYDYSSLDNITLISTISTDK